MRIALIGGLGFIGKEFTRYALENGYGVDIYDRPSEGISLHGGVTYTSICLDDCACRISEADAVVVLAAQRPYKGFCFADYEANVRVAQRCFSLAQEREIRNVVFASSKAVYSDAATMPWKESEYTTPLSLYGASKVAAEQLASLLNKDFGMAIKSLRFAQVIGMGERKGYLINTLIDNAVQGKRQTVYGDGSQRRQYIYIKDVVRAILCAIEHPQSKGVFNIGMRGSISNLELAQCVNDVFGNAGNLVCDTTKPMAGACDEMNVDKAKRELGFSARYDLYETFADLAGHADR